MLIVVFLVGLKDAERVVNQSYQESLMLLGKVDRRVCRGHINKQKMFQKYSHLGLDIVVVFQYYDIVQIKKWEFIRYQNHIQVKFRLYNG